MVRGRLVVMMPEAWCDDHPVDRLAVTFVCNGTPMHLGDDPVTLEAAVLAIGFMVSVKEIAERCGTKPTRVSRILHRHGAVHCPICTRGLICPGGVTPEHVASNGWRCEMSGYQISDVVRANLIRATNRKLARFT